jgi:hypothetical protein
VLHGRHHFSPTLHPERVPCTLWVGGSVGSRACPDVLEKKSLFHAENRAVIINRSSWLVYVRMTGCVLYEVGDNWA